MAKSGRNRRQQPAIYWELAPWFHLLTHPKSYAGEARHVVRTLKPERGQKPTMLELGSGGGNNAFQLKKHFTLTLSDLSPGMLKLSRKINPECEHVVGDMRSLPLKRSFPFVFVHDAVMYMLSERDLARAIKTAFVHCAPGGIALFQPDFVRESYRPTRERGGHSDGARKLSYVETAHPLAESANFVDVDFTLTLREPDGGARRVVDRHRVGAFPRATWISILRRAGFRVRCATDPWKRVCFIATRPLA